MLTDEPELVVDPVEEEKLPRAPEHLGSTSALIIEEKDSKLDGESVNESAQKIAAVSFHPRVSYMVGNSIIGFEDDFEAGMTD